MEGLITRRGRLGSLLDWLPITLPDLSPVNLQGQSKTQKFGAGRVHDARKAR